MRKASSRTSIGKYICRFIPLIAGMLLSLSIKAQDFDYSFTKDSVAWQELNAQMILNADNSAWKFCYKIPIGFSFEYLGRKFDSLSIETNGYIVFDEDHHFALTAFAGFGDCIDQQGNHAVLGYAISGENESRILKIQYKNVGSIYSASQYITYQVWFYQSGNKVEIRTGPETVELRNQEADVLAVMQSLQAFAGVEPISVDSLHLDAGPAFTIGLLDMNYTDAHERGYFIGGSPSQPAARPVNDQSPVPSRLTTMPNQGMKYTFQPLN